MRLFRPAALTLLLLAGWCSVDCSPSPPPPAPIAPPLRPRLPPSRPPEPDGLFGVRVVDGAIERGDALRRIQERRASLVACFGARLRREPDRAGASLTVHCALGGGAPPRCELSRNHLCVTGDCTVPGDPALGECTLNEVSTALSSPPSPQAGTLDVDVGFHRRGAPEEELDGLLP